MPLSQLAWPRTEEAAQLSEAEIRERLQRLMLLRVIFTTLLLGATILVQWQESHSMMEPGLLVLYGIIAGTYVLTFVYGIIFSRVSALPFTAFQLAMDTLQVSFIIFVTGGYASVFSFLYLVVITYSSLFFSRRWVLILAALCSIQYGILIDLEYYGLIAPFDLETRLYPGIAEVEWNRVVFKISMTAMACFLVAMLASILSEQERRTRRELRAVREHMKRVQKMAAIGEMSSRLAHEIKNPLAALVGSVRMLAEDMDLEGAEERLMMIITREAERLNELVSDFLMAARPVEAKPEALRVDECIIEVVELFQRHEICRDRIRVAVNLVADLWIQMAASHFRQVMWNLLLNAAEAIEGRGAIHIRTAIQADGQVFIRIADDGPGLAEATRNRIFEPFFTTKTKGSGLGLPVVHRILEAYGFRLDVESQPMKGSTFSIVARKAAS